MTPPKSKARASAGNRDDIAIGIDLGGSNLRAALFRGLSAHAEERHKGQAFDEKSWQPVTMHRELVSEPRDPDTILDKVTAVIERMIEEAKVTDTVPVGIGFAGMLRGHDGMVANSPYMRWREVPFGQMLKKRLGPKRPLIIENDVNAIAYAEYQVGAAVGARGALTVFVGTGIGGGLIINGRLPDSASNCVGEIGHMKVVFDQTARQCACGAVGCIEAYAGGESLARRARTELSGRKKSLAVELAGGVENVHAGFLDEAAAQGDEYAQALLAEVGPMLGATIANCVTLLNPSHCVLGGGVLGRTPVFKAYVTAAFQVAVNPPAGESCQLVDALLGDEAGLVGSALLARAAMQG